MNRFHGKLTLKRYRIRRYVNVFSKVYTHTVYRSPDIQYAFANRCGNSFSLNERIGPLSLTREPRGSRCYGETYAKLRSENLASTSKQFNEIYRACLYLHWTHAPRHRKVEAFSYREQTWVYVLMYKYIVRCISENPFKTRARIYINRTYDYISTRFTSLLI